MSKRIVLLPGWGLGVVPLQLLAQALATGLPDFTVQIQPLPDMTGKDVPSIIDQLDQQLPRDCWLVGWSLGGMLATALAAQRQAGCAGVISYASNACFVAREDWPEAMSREVFDGFYAQCLSDLSTGLKRFSLLCSQGAAQSRPLSRQLQEMALTAESTHDLAGLQLLAELDNRHAIGCFAGPQLHLLAAADALLPADAIEPLRLLNPQAQVELLGQSHASVFAEPQLLAQRMLQFIMSHQYA